MNVGVYMNVCMLTCDVHILYIYFRTSNIYLISLLSFDPPGFDSRTK